MRREERTRGPDVTSPASSNRSKGAAPTCFRSSVASHGTVCETLIVSATASRRPDVSTPNLECH